jgi:nucleoside-diphosphate-sugar epimerase
MPVHTVAVTGATSSLGTTLTALLKTAGARRVVAVDVSASDLTGPLHGADTVVHLAWAERSHHDPALLGRVNLGGTRRLLDAAAAVGAKVVVHLSSATVYGAWADNPIPLTEEAPLRPNLGFVDAVHRAEAERLVTDFALDHPSVGVAVLRPVPILGPGVDGWLSRALAGGAPVRVSQNDPPRQFVHVDDVASAVALATSVPLSGTWNVAPDGWIPGDALRALIAGRPALPLPARFAPTVASWAWSLHVADAPAGLLPLVQHPWVVANDRLRAAGWAPRYSNEEALVAGRPGRRWADMSPRRRQGLALALAGVSLTAAGAGVAALVARARARLPRPSS